MKILLITNLFYPDTLAGSALFSDLAIFFKEKNIDLRVTTTFSYYPQWKLSRKDKPFFLRNDDFRGIPVRRIKMYVPNFPTGLARILSDISFFFALLFLGRHKRWRPDLIITASPMLSQCIAQRFLYVGRDIPRLIVVQDFVVDAALELGILRLPGLRPLLRSLERWGFRSAQTLTTISKSMLNKLRSIVGEDRRLVMIPNWIHESLQKEIDAQPTSNHYRNSKTLFYSGNLGVKQGLPLFLQAFSNINSGWTLKIHGGGAEKEAVKKICRTSANIRLGGVLPEKKYVTELLSCSACLITEAPGVGANFLPSKLLPALATGTPVLAICENHSPLGCEVRQGGFGVVISPSDYDGLKALLQNWSKNKKQLAFLSARAKLWSKKYNRERVLNKYSYELLKLIS